MSMPHQSKGPSLAFIGLAAIILVAGLGIFAALLVNGILDIGKELTQVVVPGEKKLTLTKPGQYTIFHEYRSVVGGKVYSSGANLGDLTISLTGEDGKELPLTPSRTNSKYDLSGRSGWAVYEFQIAQPGTYTLAASYPEGMQGSETVLAVGHDFTGKLVITIFTCIGVLFGSIALAAVILVLTLIGRAKARNKAIASNVPFNPIGPPT